MIRVWSRVSRYIKKYGEECQKDFSLNSNLLSSDHGNIGNTELENLEYHYEFINPIESRDFDFSIWKLEFLWEFFQSQICI